MKNKLIANISTDGTYRRSASRQAQQSVECYVRPLTYGDLSEVALSVHANGWIHLTIRDKRGHIVSQHSYQQEG